VTTIVLVACTRPRQAPPPLTPEAAPVHAIVPAPSAVRPDPGVSFVVSDSTAVVFSEGSSGDVGRIADHLADLIASTVGRSARSIPQTGVTPQGAIRLVLDTAAASLGNEGYSLTVTTDSVRLTAREPAGLFYGVQTIRQLLPVAVEHRAAMRRRLLLPGISITDSPRFAWRGAMLDVSRHFLNAADVKRFIDGMALYKLNRLHLHLSDDQGWRLEIKSWPNLALVGGRSEVGGGTGGYYTQLEYADLVAYARDRFITIVPEIEMPGHSNAALASVPQLNCSGTATQPYAGTSVGFSTLCASSDTVYAIINDIIREVAALTPGDFIHIGGDEVEKLGHDAYLRFVERAERIVRSHGKRMIGWGEMSPARLDPSTVVQHWQHPEGKSLDSSFVHAARGGMVITSPSGKAYLDMKYDSTTVLGLQWSGLIGVRQSYEWDPGTLLPGVPERSVLGVEGPLWSETLEKLEDFEFLAYPRLVALAEVGWSAQDRRRWEDFRLRLGAHGPRLQALGINFHRTSGIPWQP
jgi:hexosaminidase